MKILFQCIFIPLFSFRVELLDIFGGIIVYLQIGFKSKWTTVLVMKTGTKAALLSEMRSFPGFERNLIVSFLES